MAVRPPYYLHLLLQHQPKHLLLVYFTASQPLTMSSVQDIDIEDDLIDEAFLSIILEQLQRVGGDEKPRQSRNLATNAGQLYLDQLLNCNHPERIKVTLRMSRDTFFSLRNWLVQHTQLRASMHVSIELKLAIFLYITTRPASQRDTMERYSVGNLTELL